MSPRPSRRREVLGAALDAFRRQGYDGTGIAELAATTHMTKAAVSYHFPAKSDLLHALVDPLIEALERVLADAPAQPASAEDRYQLLAEYFDVLASFTPVSDWAHSDRSVQSHPAVGPRLAALFDRAVELVAGPEPDASTRLAAATAITSLWGAVRYLDAQPGGADREVVLETVLGGLAPRLS